MSSINWEKFGEEITKTVQEAVENKDFERLSQLVKDKLNYSGYKTYTTDKEKAKHTNSQTRKTSGIHYSNVRQESSGTTAAAISRKAPSKAGAALLAAGGYLFGASQAITSIGCIAATVIPDAAFGPVGRIVTLIFGILTGAMAAGGLTFGIRQTKKIGRIERFPRYLRIIGGKEYYNISELASAASENKKTVLKDIEYMIKRRWLLQGHLDKKKTCLMVTDKMYSEYCQLEKRKEIADMDAKEQAAKQKKILDEKIAAGEMLPPEIQKVVAQGNEYIKKIRACNDAIPGKEISEKIYRIEMLTDKIFDRVEENPKSVSDIQKLMEYYLPTTVKLLEAYAQMDAQPTAGENIQAAKREIEATLDTLNVAFEKLLDSLFQETVWDVSSDISVLNTMLAQEGLKEDGLKNRIGGKK